jgi:hypothetical protein
MSELRIRVGASLDSSWDQILRNLPSATAAANRQVAAQQKAANAQQLADTKARIAQQTAAEKLALDLQAQLLKNKVRESNKIRAQYASEEAKIYEHLRTMQQKRLDVELKLNQQVAVASIKAKQRAADEEVKAATKAAKEKAKVELTEQQRVAKEVTRLREAAYRQRITQLAGAEVGRYPWQQQGRDMPYRMGYWASRNLSPVTPMLSVAGRLGHDLARGAGIDLNMGSMVSNYVQTSAAAQTLANAAYMPGDPRNARRVAASELVSQASEVATATGLSRTAAIEGLQKYVGKTGDLATARDLLKELGVLARATGTAFEDMVDASADVGNALGEVDNKGEKVTAIMRAIAGQGKMGAVEIRDLATQMAKLSAVARLYEGGAEKNIAIMGALAQQARAKGGAASATQAATSVMSFANLWDKQARIRAFEKITGEKVHTQEGLVRDPRELIISALRSTKGDPERLGDIFADAMSKRVVRGFASTYRESGGGERGIAAVRDEMSKLVDAAIGKGEVATSFELSMGGPAAQAQQFQNKLQEMTDKLATQAIPALIKLQPAALSVAEGFMSVATWLASNPLMVLPAAITAAVTKSFAEQTLRTGIENVFRTIISGQAGIGPTKTFMGVSGGGAGVGGNIAAAFTIAALAVTTIKVGMMAVDNFMESKKQRQEGAIAAEIEWASKGRELETKAAKGQLTKEEIEAARGRVSTIETEISRIQKPGVGERMLRGFARGYEAVSNVVSPLGQQASAVDDEDKRNAERANTLREEQTRLLNIISSGILDMIRASNAKAEATGMGPQERFVGPEP